VLELLRVSHATSTLLAPLIVQPPVALVVNLDVEISSKASRTYVNS
jgi:hypothetical protein